jgi:hypothetical protein
MKDTNKPKNNIDEKLEQCRQWLLNVFREGRTLEEADFEHCQKKYERYKPEVQKIIAEFWREIPDQFGCDNKNKIIKGEIYLRNNYKIRNNLVTGLLEIKNNDGIPVKQETIWVDINKDNIKLSFSDLSIMIRHVAEEFDPFEKYFYGLKGKWDGVDYIKQVSDCVTTKDQEYWNEMFKKALVRTIACAIDGKVNRTAIILISRQQNTGKTMFIRYLSPWGDAKYYCEEKFTFGDKDKELLLTQNLIYNLDELQGMDPRAMNTIKATISKSVVNIRKVYRADHEQLRRRCTFWGTSNIEQYLTDDTGNTRWLSFEIIGSIDWKTYTKVPIHNLWAQAFDLWANGYNYELTQEEGEKRDADNSEREENSNEIDACSVLFERSDNFLSNAEIANWYQTYFKVPSDTKRIGRALKKLGFTSAVRNIHNTSVRGYNANKIEPSFHVPTANTNKPIDEQDIPF